MLQRKWKQVSGEIVSGKVWLGGAFYMVVHVDLTNMWQIGDV